MVLLSLWKAKSVYPVLVFCFYHFKLNISIIINTFVPKLRLSTRMKSIYTKNIYLCIKSKRPWWFKSRDYSRSGPLIYKNTKLDDPNYLNHALDQSQVHDRHQYTNFCKYDKAKHKFNIWMSFININVCEMYSK